MPDELKVLFRPSVQPYLISLFRQNPGVAFARLRAALRRAVPAAEEPVIETGQLRIDLAHRTDAAGAPEYFLTPGVAIDGYGGLPFSTAGFTVSMILSSLNVMIPSTA